VNIQFFSKKRQFKVFLDFADTAVAKKFFTKAFSLKRLSILDEKLEEVSEREMRVYLVKSEEEFQRLALLKYTKEINQANRLQKA
jgi:hypothetical protein